MATNKDTLDDLLEMFEALDESETTPRLNIGDSGEIASSDGISISTFKDIDPDFFNQKAVLNSCFLAEMSEKRIGEMSTEALERALVLVSDKMHEVRQRKSEKDQFILKELDAIYDRIKSRILENTTKEGEYIVFKAILRHQAANYDFAILERGEFDNASCDDNVLLVAKTAVEGMYRCKFKVPERNETISLDISSQDYQDIKVIIDNKGYMAKEVLSYDDCKKELISLRQKLTEPDLSKKEEEIARIIYLLDTVIKSGTNEPVRLSAFLAKIDGLIRRFKYKNVSMRDLKDLHVGLYHFAKMYVKGNIDFIQEQIDDNRGNRSKINRENQRILENIAQLDKEIKILDSLNHKEKESITAIFLQDMEAEKKSFLAEVDGEADDETDELLDILDEALDNDDEKRKEIIQKSISELKQNDDMDEFDEIKLLGQDIADDLEAKKQSIESQLDSHHQEIHALADKASILVFISYLNKLKVDILQVIAKHHNSIDESPLKYLIEAIDDNVMILNKEVDSENDKQETVGAVERAINGHVESAIGELQQTLTEEAEEYIDVLQRFQDGLDDSEIIYKPKSEISQLKHSIEEKKTTMKQLSRSLDRLSSISQRLVTFVFGGVKKLIGTVTEINTNYAAKRAGIEERRSELMQQQEKNKGLLEQLKEEYRTLDTSLAEHKKKEEQLENIVSIPFELFLVSNVSILTKDSLPKDLMNAIILDDQNRILFVRNGKILKDKFSISHRGDIPLQREVVAKDILLNQNSILPMASYSGACDVIEEAARIGGFSLLYDMDEQRHIEAEAHKARMIVQAEKDREQKRLEERVSDRSVAAMVSDVQQFKNDNERARRIRMEEEQQQPAAVKTSADKKRKEDTKAPASEKEEADEPFVTSSDRGSAWSHETLDSWIQESNAEAKKRGELIRFHESFLSCSPQVLLSELYVLDRVHDKYKKDLERLEDERAEKVRANLEASEKSYREQRAFNQSIFDLDQKIQEVNDNISMISNKKWIIVELLNRPEIDFMALAATDLLKGFSKLNKERKNLERKRNEILEKITAMEIGILPAVDKQKIEADLKEKELRLEHIKQLKDKIKVVLELSLGQSSEGLQSPSLDEEIEQIYQERKAILAHTQELLHSSEEGYYTKEIRDREEREFIQQVSREIRDIYSKIQDPNLCEKLKKVFDLSRDPEKTLACLLAIDSIAVFLNANPNHGDNRVLENLRAIIRPDDPVSTFLRGLRLTSLLIQCNLEDLPEELSYFGAMHLRAEAQQEIEALELPVMEPKMEAKMHTEDDNFILGDREEPLSSIIGGDNEAHFSLRTDEMNRDSMQIKEIIREKKREIRGFEKGIKEKREAILDSYLSDIDYMKDRIRRYKGKALDSEQSILNEVLERLSAARVAVEMLKSENKHIPAADLEGFKVELRKIDGLLQKANQALRQPNVKSVFENFSREAILGFMNMVYDVENPTDSSSAKEVKQLKGLKTVEDIRQECYQRDCRFFESRTRSDRHRLQLVGLREKVADLQKAHQKCEKLEERMASIEAENHKPVAKSSFLVSSPASSSTVTQAGNMENQGFFRTNSSYLAHSTRAALVSRSLKTPASTLSSSSE